MDVITVKNVSKIFRRHKPRMLLRDHIRQMVAGASNEEGFYALRNVSFRVAREEGVALIGANGAGKSTMLSLVCGLTPPDEGQIQVNGSIAPLLALGSGFHPDLTGRENLFLNSALLGMNEKQVNRRFQEIVDFAELEAFIDEPLRVYSAGMSMRLAFSIAVHCDPAIVVIDEVLGVGDAAFQRKCHDKISEMRAAGKTLLCVSHSPETVKEFCERAIWLHQGEVVMDGRVRGVIEAYTEFMTNMALPAQGYAAGV